MTYRTGRQSPINIWETTDDGDVQVAMATTPHKAQQLVEAANLGETLDEQVKRLADFIMFSIPGEPSQSDGAVDTAIRLLGAAYSLEEPHDD
jgi:hypothetical protein